MARVGRRTSTPSGWPGPPVRRQAGSGPRAVNRRCAAAPSSTHQASGNPQSGTRPPGAERSTWPSARRMRTSGVGPEVLEEVDLVAPVPLLADVGGGGMVLVDDVDGELLGPRVAVEARPEHRAVLGPGVAGVGGGVDAEQAERALAPRGVDRLLLLGRPRGLADGEEGEDAGGGEYVGRHVAHVGHGHRAEIGQVGQLRQSDRGLGQGAVHAGGRVDVGRHLGDDEHVRGHARSVRLVRRPRLMIECTSTRTRRTT